MTRDRLTFSGRRGEPGAVTANGIKRKPRKFKHYKQTSTLGGNRTTATKHGYNAKV